MHDVSLSNTPYYSDGRPVTGISTGPVLTSASISFNRGANLNNDNGMRDTLPLGKSVRDVEVGEEPGGTLHRPRSEYDIDYVAVIRAREESNESLAKTIKLGDGEDIELVHINT